LALLILPTARWVAGLKALLVYVVHPAPLAVHRGMGWAREVPSNVAALLDADQENRRLRDEFRRVELLRTRARALEEENARLRGILGLKPPEGRGMLWAAILHREPGHWFRHLVLDRGEKDGVRLDAPVLAPGDSGMAVVGRIAEVGPRTAKVLLVTDDLSSVAATLHGGWAALAEGSGAPTLRLNYISALAKPEPGQEVLTSELSSIFPAGLPIGRVVEVFLPDPHLSFLTARLEPSAPLSRIREVAVLKP